MCSVITNEYWKDFYLDDGGFSVTLLGAQDQLLDRAFLKGQTYGVAKVRKLSPLAVGTNSSAWASATTTVNWFEKYRTGNLGTPGTD